MPCGTGAVRAAEAATERARARPDFMRSTCTGGRNIEKVRTVSFSDPGKLKKTGVRAHCVL